MVRRLLGIGLALSLSSTAAALDPDRSLKELHHTAWRAREGAPSQISALAQTQDGYGAREHEILRLLMKAEIMARDSCVNGAMHGADARGCHFGSLAMTATSPASASSRDVAPGPREAEMDRMVSASI